MEFNNHTLDFKHKQEIFLKNSTLAHYCTDEQKKIIIDNVSCRLYHKGEVIFYEGQPSYLIFFVNSGVIKLWKECFHKVEQIIRFSKEGDMVGFWSSLENSSYTLSATALLDSQICFIKKDVFLPIVQSNAMLSIILHDYIKELKKTEEDLRNMAEMNVREKVAHALLVMLEVFKGKLDEKAYKVALSRKEISALSAISEDRVSKQISEFKKENIIIDDKTTFIDKKALQKIINPYIMSY